MNPGKLSTQSHAVFQLYYHVIFTTKYRHQCLTASMLARLEALLSNTLSAWRCQLIEFGGETDHVHFLIAAHPALNLAHLLANLKTVTARRVRQEFVTELRPFYWKPYFWNRAYAVISVGGRASLETLLDYIQQQETPLD